MDRGLCVLLWLSLLHASSGVMVKTGTQVDAPPDKVVRYTGGQVNYLFAIISACAENPTGLTVESINRLRHISDLFSLELKAALINEVQLVFETKMAIENEEVGDKLMEQYISILDLLQNWNVSHKNLVKIFAMVGSYVDGKITADRLQSSIAAAFNEEMEETEKVLQQGDVDSSARKAVTSSGR